MLDIKWIRENQKEFNDLLNKRGIKIDLSELIALDEEKRQIDTLSQKLCEAKNKKTKHLANFKSKSVRDITEIKRDINHIDEKLKDLEAQSKQNVRLQEIMNIIPNLLNEEVPYGSDETMNRFVKDFTSTTIRLSNFDSVKSHFDIGSNLGMMDFEQTAKISGSRFVTLTQDLAKLERALINFMIDLHTSKFGFIEISSPAIVRSEAMYNAGQLPKFYSDSYEISDKKLRLIPTGEVPMINMVADSIVQKNKLPIRYVGYTPCFRSEAGSAGRDTRGMIRNHQFGKVELVVITAEEQSKHEHEYILNASEEVLKQLDLSYRVMLLCSGETGFTSRKTYDIEVWLPGQKKYREISSISNCGDFQARRMKARYKESGCKETKFLHTLNGSGLPIGRTIVAILENYQNIDGSVTIPNKLIPYMDGKKKIETT